MSKAALTVLGRAYVSVMRGWCAGGLVGVSGFAVLPDVGPGAALALVLAALAPCLIRLWRAPSPSGFVHAVSYAAMCRRAWLRAESACWPALL